MNLDSLAECSGLKTSNNRTQALPFPPRDSPSETQNIAGVNIFGGNIFGGECFSGVTIFFGECSSPKFFHL